MKVVLMGQFCSKSNLNQIVNIMQTTLSNAISSTKIIVFQTNTKGPV